MNGRGYITLLELEHCETFRNLTPNCSSTHRLFSLVNTQIYSAQKLKYFLIHMSGRKVSFSSSSNGRYILLKILFKNTTFK